jgi:hypothetical protein
MRYEIVAKVVCFRKYYLHIPYTTADIGPRSTAVPQYPSTAVPQYRSTEHSGGFDVDARHAALAAMGLFVAGVVKGTTGLGYSTCALPFLVAAIGLKAAIVIVPVPAMAANIGLLLGAGHIRETLHRFWKFYAAAVPGIFFGTMLLGVVDQRPATRVLGLIIIFYRVSGSSLGIFTN